MLEEQLKVMRAVVPIHRQLQQQDQVEVSTTPFYHPILPLLVDTDRATIDRPGASHPRRFAHPEDAEAQVRLAADAYRSRSGRPPRGLWPAEGAVGRSVVPLFARGRALDRDRPWGAGPVGPVGLRRRRPGRALPAAPRRGRAEQTVSVFFRDPRLSDRIGFRYKGYGDGGRRPRTSSPRSSSASPTA